MTNKNSQNNIELNDVNDQYSIFFNKNDILILMNHDLNFETFRMKLKYEKNDYIVYIVQNNCENAFLNHFEKYQKFLTKIIDLRFEIKINI